MNTSILEALAGKSALLVNDNSFDGVFLEGLLDQAEIKVAVVSTTKEASLMMAGRVFDFLILDLQCVDDSLSRFLEESSVTRIANKIRTIGIINEDSVETNEHQVLDALITKPLRPDVFFEKLSGNWAIKKASDFDLPETDLINISDGLMRLGGNKDAYARVLELFVNNQRKVPEEIMLALDSGDLKRAHLLAHSLKGVAGNVGATRVQEAALPLEQALKRLEKGEAQHLLPELEKNFTKVVKVIDDWLEAKQHAVDKAPRNPSVGGLKGMGSAVDLLEQLGKAIDARRPVECEPIMEKLMLLDWPNELEDEIKELERLTRGFRFRSAEILLDRLLKTSLAGG